MTEEDRQITDGDDSQSIVSRASTVTGSRRNLSSGISMSMGSKLAKQKKIEAEMKIKKAIRVVVEGNVVTVIMSLVTLYALIGVSIILLN
jgi:hypothetical protein